MLKKAVIFLFSCMALTLSAQKTDSLPKDDSKPAVRTISTQTVPEISKSVRTATPTIIKMKRSDLVDVVTIQDLIKTIPSTCFVSSSSVTVKHPGGQSALTANYGNVLNYEVQALLLRCSWILFENICSSCPREHKANYKIVIE